MVLLEFHLKQRVGKGEPTEELVYIMYIPLFGFLKIYIILLGFLLISPFISYMFFFVNSNAVLRSLDTLKTALKRVRNEFDKTRQAVG